MAVCTFCKSTLVREDDALRRIGQSAELFDDLTSDEPSPRAVAWARSQYERAMADPRPPLGSAYVEVPVVAPRTMSPSRAPKTACAS